LCIVDVSSGQEQALEVIGDAARLMPVVAWNTNNDAGLILRCLRRGAREFLAEASAGQLTVLLNGLSDARTAAPARKTGKLYCVLPGKPGCGASTLAVHLAVQMHADAEKVLLVDTDPLTA